MDRVDYFSGLDDYRYALGVTPIENFGLNMEHLRSASCGSIKTGPILFDVNGLLADGVEQKSKDNK